MIDTIKKIFLESAETKSRSGELLAGDIAAAAELLIEAYRTGRKSIIFGNGGSAADAQHYAAELTGRFVTERRALPAIALTVDTSALTSIGNDYGFDRIFSRQLEAFAQPGDIAVGISTSGNSPNVLRALERARELSCRTIGLSGRDGGAMRAMCDVCVIAPSESTARIQEVHITVLHIWCGLIEKGVFGSGL